jgi:hypothetical protein
MQAYKKFFPTGGYLTCVGAGDAGRSPSTPGMAGPVPGLAPIHNVHADINFEALVAWVCLSYSMRTSYIA